MHTIPLFHLFPSLLNISTLLGLAPSAFALLFCILFTYPYSLLFRILHKQTTPVPAHLTHLITGTTLSYLAYGNDAIHLVILPLATWTAMKLLHPKQAYASTWIGAMTYLLIGYWKYSTDNYDIDWTTPFSVMTLRMIAVAADVMDGKEKEPPTPNAIDSVPGLVPFLGFTFLPHAFFVGPQIPYIHYQKFTSKALFPGTHDIPSGSWSHTFRCLGYFAIYHAASMFLPIRADSIYDPSFRSLSTMRRIILGPLIGRLCLMKYITIWKLTEGAASIMGISYDPVKKDYSAANNVSPLKVEFADTLNGYIIGFNISTNQWCKHYIFKRLRFLGNKDLSSIGVLFFLYIWHGFHVGYAMTFGLEFLMILSEKALGPHTNVPWLLKNLATFWTVGVALVFFEAKSLEKCWAVSKIIGHIELIFLVLPLFALLGRRKPSKKSVAGKKKD